MVLSALNVPVTSIIAVFSVAGLAVSLALQNTLSNLASGIVIMVSKPFVVGDYVEIDNVGGTVSTVGLVYSMLVTPEIRRSTSPTARFPLPRSSTTPIWATAAWSCSFLPPMTPPLRP